MVNKDVCNRITLMVTPFIAISLPGDSYLVPAICRRGDNHVGCLSRVIRFIAKRVAFTHSRGEKATVLLPSTCRGQLLSIIGCVGLAAANKDC